MRNNETANSGAPSARLAIGTVDANIRDANLAIPDETEPTLAGMLRRVVTVFTAIRPLLLVLITFPILPPASRSAVSVFVQSLDALSVIALPGDTGDAADFKAGRDLEE